MKKVLGLIAAGVICLSTMSFAQEAGRSSPVIRHRYHNQQKRIAQGIRSGSLTPREAARLERREGHLRRETRRMRSDGSFTPRERARVTRQQNRLSRDIYRQKHDGQVR